MARKTKKTAETFAARLRRLRTEAGLTQRALADNAGFHVATVQQWEGGRRQPSLADAAKLARALGVSLDELAGIDTPPSLR